MDQYSTPTTTANSQDDGRMKVGITTSYGKKKKYLKGVVSGYSKKDGKGGPGLPSIDPPGYGSQPPAAPATGLSSMMPPNNVIPGMTPLPALSLSNKNTAFKMARPLRLKKMSSISTSIKALNKKMKFGKVVGKLK